MTKTAPPAAPGTPVSPALRGHPLDVRTLMASTAIPVLFPSVHVDDHRGLGGGATTTAVER